MNEYGTYIRNHFNSLLNERFWLTGLRDGWRETIKVMRYPIRLAIP